MNPAVERAVRLQPQQSPRMSMEPPAASILLAPSETHGGDEPQKGSDRLSHSLLTKPQTFDKANQNSLVEAQPRLGLRGGGLVGDLLVFFPETDDLVSKQLIRLSVVSRHGAVLRLARLAATASAVAATDGISHGW